MGYCAVADVQALVPTSLVTFGAGTVPTTNQVTGWIEQVSAWMDAALRWRYEVPVADADDLLRLQPVAAHVVASMVLAVLDEAGAGTGLDLGGRSDRLYGRGLMLFVYQPGSVRPAGTSLFRLGSDPPREGKSFLLLPNTTEATTGEAVRGGPVHTFTSEPGQDGAPNRAFTLDKVF